MSALSDIIQFANTQHGVVARFQYKQLVIGEASMEKALRNPVFSRYDQGVYEINNYAQTWHNKAAKALLSCGPNALLSHTSALINYALLPTNTKQFFGKMYPFQNDPNKIHILCNRDKRHYRNINYHRTTKPEIEKERNIVNNLSTVSVERALVESAQTLGEYNLSQILHLAISKNLTSAKQINSKLLSLKAAPGRGIKVISSALTPYLLQTANISKIESILEKRVYDVITKMTSLDVVLQHEVHTGTKTIRIDMAVLSLNLAIEIDGFAYHSSIEQLSRDQYRQNDLVNLGWKVIRLNAKMTNEQMLYTILAATDHIRPAS